jgi:hypothetical protein
MVEPAFVPGERLLFFSSSKENHPVKALRAALRIIGDAKRPYVILNLVYYGLVACGVTYAAFDRSIQQSLLENVDNALTAGPLAAVAEAYRAEQVVLAVGLTVGINLAVGSFASITLPSLIIPFSGLLVAGIRAVTWGLLFSPQSVSELSPGEALTGVLFVVLVILEGQGYILAAMGAYLQGRAFLWPQRAGATGHRQGYWRGLKDAARIYLLVALVLLVAAVYEVWFAVAAAPGLR